MGIITGENQKKLQIVETHSKLLFECRCVGKYTFIGKGTGIGR